MGLEPELLRGNLERLPLADAEFESSSRSRSSSTARPASGDRELARVLRPGRPAPALDRQQCASRHAGAERAALAGRDPPSEAGQPGETPVPSSHGVEARARRAARGRGPRDGTHAHLQVQRRRRVAAAAAAAEQARRPRPDVGWDICSSWRAVRSPSIAPVMRYVVRGAAGFIGSHPPHAARAGARCSRLGLVHRLLRPDAEGGERPGASGRAADLAEDELVLEGVDGVFHLAGQPGVPVGAVFPVYAAERARERTAVPGGGRGGARTVLASSSLIYGDAVRIPRQRKRPHVLFPRTGSRSSRASISRPHMGRTRPRRRRAPLLHDLRAAPAPDMALLKDRCLVDLRAFELHGDGSQSRSVTYVEDAVEATILPMERASTGPVVYVGGGEELWVLQWIEMPRSPGGGPSSSVARAVRETRRERWPIPRGSAPRPAGSRARARGRARGPVVGAADRARPDERPPCSRSRRAGGRSRIGLAAPEAALVAPIGGLVLGAVVGLALAPLRVAPCGWRNR